MKMAPKWSNMEKRQCYVSIGVVQTKDKKLDKIEKMNKKGNEKSVRQAVH